MNSPKISIIVPVYNVESYLPKCLHSLLSQTLKDIEIILIDDESPDNSPAICDEYAKLDSRVKVIHKKNGGLGFARNSGLEIAIGEYITFVDSDDYVETNAYENLYTLAKEHNLDILRYNYNRFTKEGKFINDNTSNAFSIYTTSQDIRQIALCIFSVPIDKNHAPIGLGGSACTGIYKKELLSTYNLRFHSEKELISEDFVFSYDCYLHAKRIGKIQQSFYHYRVNPISLTTQLFLDKLDKAKRFSQYMTHRMMNDGYSSKDAQLYPMGYFLAAIRAQMKLVLCSPLPIKDKKKWFYSEMSKQYVKEIYNEYPIKVMPRKHRIHFLVAYHKHFWCMYILVYTLILIRKIGNLMKY